MNQQLIWLLACATACAVPADEPSAGDDESEAVAAVSGPARVASDAALARLGAPFRFGAAGPDAFDAPGLARFAWGKAGIALPHSVSLLANQGTAIARASVDAGDLVFYGQPTSHVAIAVSPGTVVEAVSGPGVRSAPLDSRTPSRFRRIR